MAIYPREISLSLASLRAWARSFVGRRVSQELAMDMIENPTIDMLFDNDDIPQLITHQRAPQIQYVENHGRGNLRPGMFVNVDGTIATASDSDDILGVVEVDRCLIPDEHGCYAEGDDVPVRLIRGVPPYPYSDAVRDAPRARGPRADFIDELPIQPYNPAIRRSSSSLDEKYPHKCFDCKRALHFKEVLDANPTIAGEDLYKMWISPHVELYCCNCFAREHRAEMANRPIEPIERIEFRRDELVEMRTVEAFDGHRPREIELVLSLASSAQYDNIMNIGYRHEPLTININGAEIRGCISEVRVHENYIGNYEMRLKIVEVPE